MAVNDRYTAEQFIQAIHESGGLITVIAQRVGCTWNTAKKYITTRPTIKAAYDDECERINDMAQNVILKSIRDGDPQMAKWWLAKKRRDEFGDSVDLTSGGQPVQIRVVYDEKPTAGDG